MFFCVQDKESHFSLGLNNNNITLKILELALEKKNPSSFRQSASFRYLPATVCA